MSVPRVNAGDMCLWDAVVERELSFIEARSVFFTRCSDRLKVLREAITHPVQRGSALRILPFLPVEERLQLFETLLAAASVGHADIDLSRQAILSLPREWVIAKIEEAAEPILQAGDDEEYRRLMEIYDELDPGLTLRLATRASQHDDPHVREAGKDFLERGASD
jgi:hypothetical protein